MQTSLVCSGDSINNLHDGEPSNAVGELATCMVKIGIVDFMPQLSQQHSKSVLGFSCQLSGDISSPHLLFNPIVECHLSCISRARDIVTFHIEECEAIRGDATASILIIPDSIRCISDSDNGKGLDGSIINIIFLVDWNEPINRSNDACSPIRAIQPSSVICLVKIGLSPIFLLLGIKDVEARSTLA